VLVEYVLYLASIVPFVTCSNNDCDTSYCKESFFSCIQISEKFYRISSQTFLWDMGEHRRVVFCPRATLSSLPNSLIEVHKNLGGNKTYKCPNSSCGAVMDRDVNGAKNIFLRNYQALDVNMK